MNLARWKLVQNTAISLLVFLLAWQAGAEPTITVLIIAFLNGISLIDLLALWSGSGGITIMVGRDGGSSQSAQSDSSDKKSDSK